MLDAFMRPLIDPPLARLGRVLARAGLHADWITLAGLGFGLAAAAAVWAGAFWLALALLLASRLADGLDGAVARARGASAFGGYLDIVCDFVFYAAFPLAFVLADPAANGAAGAFLLAAFYVNGASLLGLSILAEQARLKTRARGEKAFYFPGGLMEGTETILFFVAFCFWPAGFAPLAWVFGALCLLGATIRLVDTARRFRDPG